MSGPEPVRLDLARYDPASNAYVVEQLIRPNSIALMAGPVGIGKSLIRKEIELRAVAGGGTILGRYEVTRPLRVLTIDEDNGADEEALRDDVALSALGLDRSEMVGGWRLSLGGFRLDEERWRLWLRAQIEDKRIELLILDPVSEMYAVEEVRNKLYPLARFLRSLLAEFPDLTILLVHHTRKMQAGANAATRTVEDVRGAVWAQIASTVVVLSPIGDRRLKWEVHKRVPHSELVIEITDAGIRAVADLAARRVTTEDRVLVAVDAGASSADEVMIATGIARSTVYEAIKRLRQDRILDGGAVLKRAEG